MASTEDELVQHYDAVHRILTGFVPDKQSVDDLVQQTYVRALTYVEDRGPPENARPWLITIARNVYRDVYRRQASAPIPFEQPELVSDGSTSPLEQAAAEDACSYVRESCEKLRPADRSLLKRYYVSGDGCKEIGEQLGISAALVKDRLFRARRRLRALLDVDAL